MFYRASMMLCLILVVQLMQSSRIYAQKSAQQTMLQRKAKPATEKQPPTFPRKISNESQPIDADHFIDVKIDKFNWVTSISDKETGSPQKIPVVELSDRSKQAIIGTIEPGVTIELTEVTAAGGSHFYRVPLDKVTWSPEITELDKKRITSVWLRGRYLKPTPK